MAIKVFFEDVWEEIITRRGFSLLENNGIFAIGNYFQTKRRVSIPEIPRVKPDIVIATNPELRLLQFVSPKTPLIFYALFPDKLIGWDEKKRSYKRKISNRFYQSRMKLIKVLTNSCYTKKLIEKSLPSFFELKIEVCPLGIDVKSIANIEPLIIGKESKVRVLWNHMWRMDKGFISALEIIDDLSKKYPEVEFYIGRKERWGGKSVGKLKKVWRLIAPTLLKRKNIFIKATFSLQDEYWRFIKSMSIGFSTAYHETFGLSMLEQAAAGIACVAPYGEVYPETLPEAMLVPRNQIEAAITKLIESEAERKRVAVSCQRNAEKYSIEKFVNRLVRHLISVIKRYHHEDRSNW